MTSYWISAAQSECRRQNRKIRPPPPQLTRPIPLWTSAMERVQDPHCIRSAITLIDGSEAGVNLVLIQTFLLYYVNQVFLCWYVFFEENFHDKANEVCIKTRSTPASYSLEGQGTKSTQQWSTTVKWSIQNDSFSAFWRVLVWKTGDNGETEQRSNALVWWDPQPLYKGAWEVRCLAVTNESKRYWTEKSRYINWLIEMRDYTDEQLTRSKQIIEVTYPGSPISM